MNPRTGNPDLERRVWSIFGRRLQLDVPSTRTDIVDTGILDSVAFVNLIVEIEEEFGVRVPVVEIELDDFRTIESISAYLARRQAGGPSAGAAPAAAEQAAGAD